MQLHLPLPLEPPVKGGREVTTCLPATLVIHIRPTPLATFYTPTAGREVFYASNLCRDRTMRNYSHSIVLGGFELIS